MSYRLICFDMDGTLLNSSKEISQESQRAIEKAVAAGKNVALSTGRSLPEIVPFYSQLKDVRYFICISGALIYDRLEEKVIFSRNIPASSAEKLLLFSKTRDVMVHIHSFQSVVEKSKLDRMDYYQMGTYTSMFKKITSPVDDVMDFYRAYPDQLAKINFYHRSTQERQETKAILEAAGCDLELAYSEFTSLECSAKGVSKGTGLIKLCQHLGIDVQDSVAVGDSDNDLAILKTCGLPVAMGNANENVRKLAGAVVADNDHEGCAEAIYRFMLP